MFNPLSIEWWRSLFTKHGNKFAIFLVLVFALPLVFSYGSGCGSGGSGQGQAAATANAVVARINGEEITRVQFDNAVQRGGAQPGEQYAAAQGRAFDSLTSMVVVKQAAKKADARPTDAEVDRKIAEMKEQIVGKEGKEADWDTYLYKQINKTPSELRELVAESMVGEALQTKYLAAETVTDADAKKQYDQVKMQLVLLATELPMGSALPQGAQVYSDDAARKKADALYAKAKTGDIAAIARTESADVSRTKGGDTDWRNEFRDSPIGGSLGFGEAFDEAVRKAAKGEFTPVVVSTGSPKGYLFAKITDRRPDLPKTFDSKKEIEQLKQQRVQKKLTKLIQDGVKAAKVEVLDPDKKAYYEFAKFQKMEQHKQMGNSPFAAMMGLPEGPPPSQADIDKQKALAYKELEESLKRNPEDPTLNLLVASNVEKDLANVTKNRDRLIKLYETALKTTEDQETRFKLAGYYRDKGDKVNAAKNFEQIFRMTNASPGYDANSMQTELTIRQRLGAAFKSVDKTDLVEKNDAEIQKLMPRIIEAQVQQKAEQQKQALEQQKAGAGAGQPPINITPVSPGQAVPQPKDSGSDAKKPEDKPATGTTKDATKTP